MLSGITMMSNVTTQSSLKSGQMLQAFTDEQAARLTGLTKGQLRAWDRKEFFAPHYGATDRRLPYSRIYSFQDVVGLRTIYKLRHDHHVSVQQLKKAAAELVRRGYGNWANTRIYVVKKQVHFQPPGARHAEGLDDGQLAMIPVIDVIQDIEARVREMAVRAKNQKGKIEQHKFIAHNSPMVAGTRIPTAAIRRFHDAGYSIEAIISEYPSLSPADVRAALKFEKAKRAA
jgi:uncharacterized protein (DUF433 family)